MFFCLSVTNQKQKKSFFLTDGNMTVKYDTEEFIRFPLSKNDTFLGFFALRKHTRHFCVYVDDSCHIKSIIFLFWITTQLHRSD